MPTGVATPSNPTQYVITSNGDRVLASVTLAPGKYLVTGSCDLYSNLPQRIYAFVSLGRSQAERRIYFGELEAHATQNVALTLGTVVRSRSMVSLWVTVGPLPDIPPGSSLALRAAASITAIQVEPLYNGRMPPTATEIVARVAQRLVDLLRRRG